MARSSCPAAAPSPPTDVDGKNPPHRKAADRYREIIDAGNFVCTMEWPSEAEPSPVMFGVDAAGAGILSGDVVELSARAAVEKAAAGPRRRLAAVAAAASAAAVVRRRPVRPEPPPSRTHGPARSASRTRPPRAAGRRRQRPPSVSAVTDGPDLAERQLRELAAVSGGSVEVLATQDTAGGRWFTISMDTSGIPAGAGIRVRDRERFHILAGHGLPAPAAVSPGAPPPVGAEPACAVGRHLCLYAAPSVEWVPSDGMDGFIERLAAWVVRAAEGTLDPDGQPLHPPVAYPAAGPAWRWSIPMSATGPRGRLAPGELGEPPVTSMVAWCTLAGDRVDVLEWISWLTAYDRVLADGFSPFHGGRPLMVMPVLLISGELGFEYPDRAWDLVTALGEAGFSLDGILTVLADAIIINRVLRISQVQAGPDAAGRPGRRRSGRRGRQRPAADRAADRHTITAESMMCG